MESKKNHPHWVRRLLSLPTFKTVPTLADVRLFSECDVQAKAVGGRLLGRWAVTADHVLNWGTDFANEPIDDVVNNGDKLVHALLVDFAVTPDESKCVLVETDLEGKVECAVYNISGGLNSDYLGPIIGSVETKTVKRRVGDPYPPEGWTPCEEGNKE